MPTYAFPRRIPLILVPVALSFWPLAARERPPGATAGAVSDRPPASKLESTVETSIAPGDDFFAYANGAWLKAAEIPPGKDRWGVRDEINDRARRQVLAILDEAGTSRPGTLARKVADFRAALLNRSAIEDRGIAPLTPALSRIDRITDKSALARHLGGTMRADVDPLNFGVYDSATVLGLSVEHSIHGEDTYTAFLVQGGLGLGDRERYLSPEPAAVEQRSRYEQSVARLLTLAGLDRAEERAKSVLALETAIAETHATGKASAVDANADNQWSRADFAREAPGIDWNSVFEAAGLRSQPVVVAWQPTAIRGVASLIASQPLEAWKE